MYATQVRPLAALAFALTLAGCASLSTAPESGIAYVNGQWFNGQGFEARTMYVVGDRFSERAPRNVANNVDLKGAFVVPPYAEAHNHNVESAATFDAANCRYMKEGIFYVQNPNNVAEVAATSLDKIGKADSIDVVYSNGGFTASDGHPIRLYGSLLQYGVYPGWKAEDLDNKAYFTVDSEADLEKKWPVFLATKPGFVKTYLLHSEEYEQRRGKKELAGVNGLNPALLPKIVAKAKAAGLRVMTHIETAHDFKVGVEAGVDGFAHLPGYMLWPGNSIDAFKIDEAAAKRAGKRGLFVITTTVLSVGAGRMSAETVAQVQDMQRRNLKLLHQSGVKLVIGSDNFMGTATGEVNNLAKLGVFDNVTLLRLWSETTPQSMFPARKLGKFGDGYEASFLVLDANPLDSFTNTQRITQRVKRGVEVVAPKC